MAGPLEGVRVLELATHVAVPTAARCMADWGADVVKVESLTGDLWRVYGRTVRTPITDEEDPIFDIPNANKKMIAIDMKSAEGQEIIHKLLENTDVVMSNIRLKSLKKLELDYDSLKERYPKLVYLHFTGYGNEGPLKDAPGFDIAAFWGAGSMYGAWAPGECDIRAMIPSSSFGDMVCSSMVLSGVLAALVRKERTGEGSFLTTSLYANALWYNYSDVISMQPQYGFKRPNYYRGTGNPLSSGYECGDGRWIYIACLEFERYYAKVFPILGHPEFVEQVKTTPAEDQLKLRRSFMPAIEEAFKTKTADEWVRIFLAVDVVITKIALGEELYQSEQGWANGFLQKVEYPNGHENVQPNSPVKFAGMEVKPSRHVGGLGADTREVLESLGYSDGQIAAMAEKKSIIAK